MTAVPPAVVGGARNVTPVVETVATGEFEPLGQQLRVGADPGHALPEGGSVQLGQSHPEVTSRTGAGIPGRGQDRLKFAVRRYRGAGLCIAAVPLCLVMPKRP